MLIELSLMFVGVLVVYFLVEQMNFRIRKIPRGPVSLPLIGNALQLQPHRIMIQFNEMAQKYGQIFSVKLGPERTVILNSLEAVSQAYRLNTCNDRPSTMAFKILNVTDTGVGYGTQEYGTSHIFHTALIKQALKFYQQQHLNARIAQEFSYLTTRLDAVKTDPFDIKPFLRHTVYNIMCAILFGKRYQHWEDPELQQLKQCFNEIEVAAKPTHVINTCYWMRHFTDRGFKPFFDAVKIRDDYMSKKIQEHQDTFDPENIRDLCDTLILAEKQAIETGRGKDAAHLSRSNMANILFVLFIAGEDATTTALSWAVLYMATFKEAARKAQAELDSVIGRDRFPELKDRRNLPYIEAFCREIFRLSSFNMLGIPHLTADNITVNDFFIPKGTQVMANFWAINHDESLWEDSYNFKPERFLDEFNNLVNKPGYVPFGKGLRSCSGMTFAQSEMFLIISSLLHAYDFSLPEGTTADLEGEASFTLKPKPYQVVIQKRPLNVSS